MLSLVTAVSRTHGNLLREASESVAELGRLSPHPIEWILVSDGPPVVEIIACLAPMGEVEITVLGPDELPEATVGRASIARNRALAVSKYDWHANVDDDDLIHSEGFAKLLALAADGDHDWLAGSFLNLHGEEVSSPPPLPAPYRGLQQAGTFRAFLQEHRLQPILGAAGIIRKSIVEDLGGWPIQAYHQDTQLWLNVTDRYDGFFHDDPVYIWRRHEAQMTPQDTSNRPPLWT